ncbi:hypothetical protein E4T43_02612 [Aureobasidium subglaciale]|nr:hypothetical protein E4T43_02612 [Aureobasidium subglaciale]
MIYQGCAQDSYWTGRTIAEGPVTETFLGGRQSTRFYRPLITVKVDRSRQCYHNITAENCVTAKVT